METIAQLVKKAISNVACVAPVSLRLLPFPSQRIWSAQVVVRGTEGCHLRIGDKHDVFVPSGYVPDDVDEINVRIQKDGLAVLQSV